MTRENQASCFATARRALAQAYGHEGILSE
jgi:hypothetical protein